MQRRRIIQVGLGAMGRGWANLVAESRRWAAAAYVDVNESNLMAAAAAHGMPKERCFTDFNEAVGAIEAEAVLDVTPPQARKAICLEAFRNGLHVLCEKPLADTVAEAKTIVDAATLANRTFMVAQNYRFQPIMQTMRRAIAKGRLGAIGYVNINFFKGPRFGGFREEMPYPLALDMCIHHFDLLRFLLDADIETVQAASINAPWNWNKGDASIMAQLEMSGGVTANYCGSWVSTGWESGWNADWRIEGAKGVLLLEQDTIYFSNKAGSRKKIPLVKCARTQQAHLLDAFARALDAGLEPETSGKKNLNSFAATHAVVCAAQERRRVLVRELIDAAW